MRKQEDIKLLSGDFALHLDLIAKVRGLNSAVKFFEDLPDKMKDHTTCNALLHTYTQYKMCDEAEALMTKMSECGFLNHPLPYNHMLTLYISGEQLEKVPGMIEELKKNTSPDVVTYNLWLSLCAIENDVESAEKVYLELKKERIDPDWITYSTLANIYIKNSLKQKAASCLGEMEKRISKRYRSAYSSLISLHTGLGNKDQVYWVWKKMKSLFPKLNNLEYMCMIDSLLKLDEHDKAEKIYNEWDSVSPVKDPRIPNLLLSAYINKNQMEKAEKFYNHMVRKGMPSSYNTLELLTKGYLKQNQMEKVLDFFKRAIGSVKEWEPDETMVEKVFAIIIEHDYIEGAEELLVTLRRAGYVTTEIYNSVLRTYAKAGKMPVIVAERMKMDNVKLNDETHQLIKLTSKMQIAEIPISFASR